MMIRVKIDDEPIKFDINPGHPIEDITRWCIEVLGATYNVTFLYREGYWFSYILYGSQGQILEAEMNLPMPNSYFNRIAEGMQCLNEDISDWKPFKDALINFIAFYRGLHQKADTVEALHKTLGLPIPEQISGSDSDGSD